MFRVPSFNYVGSKLGNGMLYSTANTRALIELLAAIQRDGDALTPRHDFDFELNINPRKLKLGERTQLQIMLNEDSICRLARVELFGTHV